MTDFIISIRSAFYFVCLILTTLVFSLLLIAFGWLLKYPVSSAVANAWGLVNLKLMKWICGLDYRIEGEENIPEGSVIILSKHQSAWETIAFKWLLPPLQTWVLKKELMSIPVFGWALAVLEPIAIDRNSGRKAARQIIDAGIEKLGKGRSVILFPEGTRVAPGSRKKYGIGGALLAQKSGYPVLPVAHNAGVFWRRRGLKKYPGTVHVVFGPLIESEGKSAAAINREVESWIESTMQKLPQTRS
ncbi:MAG: lysophospholipid acyltransferase family protein [Pseudomonadota bacterium]|nr:lysophospholipid acyltransferase family protein [Pseudomonadota bacterium]